MATLPPFATVVDLGEWLGEDLESDATAKKRAERALRMASGLVRAETRREWVDENNALVDPLPDVLNLVTVQSAARGYENPHGMTSANEGIDDFQAGERYLVQEAGIYLTDSEKGLLFPLSGRAFGGLGTVSRTRGESAPIGVVSDGSDERILPPYY